MGLGLHGGGVGAANYFTSKGSRVIVTDLKREDDLRESIEKLKNRKLVKLVLGEHRYRDFGEADLIIKNPGVPKDSPFISYALERGIRVDTDIGVFIDEIRGLTGNVVGITGTKGKSTTAALIHRVIGSRLDVLLAGNITVSVLEILDNVKKDTWVVLELSSFQLGDIRGKRFSPRIGVFTNLMEDHLDYYPDMESYFRDKETLYAFQGPGDIFVINREDDVFGRVGGVKGERITFGLSARFDGPGTYVKGDTVYFRSKVEMPVIEVKNILLRGGHNLFNVLGAAAAACGAGFDPGDVGRSIADFKGLRHRLEFIAERKGVRYYNDSAATTPLSAVRGIESFSEPVVLIAGGSDKGLAARDLAEAVNRKVGKLILLEGTGTKRLLEEGLDIPYTVCSGIEDAVHLASRQADSGDTVLLSPGFASFGMFKNEFHRGDTFREAVLNL